jgi:hypothetical protein
LLVGATLVVIVAFLVMFHGLVVPMFVAQIQKRNKRYLIESGQWDDVNKCWVPPRQRGT